METEIQRLSNILLPEVVKAFGLPDSPTIQQLVHALIHKATDRLAAYAWRFDQTVRQHDIPRAALDLLERFCTPPRISGLDCIPNNGPTLVVSNHPGTYDSLVLLSQIHRPDLRMIASKIPFIHSLPNARQHFIFVTQDINERMTVIRKALRHLKENGTLVLFGSGQIDPDPAVYPDAARDLQSWYSSVELLLRLMPQARLVLCVVSHVVSKKWAHHPITWFRRSGVNRRRLAEFGQLIQQLVNPQHYYLTPCVSFSRPYVVEELRAEARSDTFMPAILQREYALLTEHVQRFDCLPQIAPA
jgi:hypothetical protein